MTKVMSRQEAIEYQHQKQIEKYQEAIKQLHEEISLLQAGYNDAATKAYMLTHKTTVFLNAHPEHMSSVLMRKWNKLYRETNPEFLSGAVRLFAVDDLQHPAGLAQSINAKNVNLDVLPNPAAGIAEYRRNQAKAQERNRYPLK